MCVFPGSTCRTTAAQPGGQAASAPWAQTSVPRMLTMTDVAASVLKWQREVTSPVGCSLGHWHLYHSGAVLY